MENWKILTCGPGAQGVPTCLVSFYYYFRDQGEPRIHCGSLWAGLVFAGWHLAKWAKLSTGRPMSS